MKTKAVLKKSECASCNVRSHPNGLFTTAILHDVEYDFMYDDELNFYLIIDDKLFLEVSTAFKFVQLKK